MEIQSESIKKLIATYDRYIENCKKSADYQRKVIESVKQECNGCPDKYLCHATYINAKKTLDNDEMLITAHENSKHLLNEICEETNLVVNALRSAKLELEFMFDKHASDTTVNEIQKIQDILKRVNQ